MKQKLFGMVAALCAALVLLTACGGGATPAVSQEATAMPEVAPDVFGRDIPWREATAEEVEQYQGYFAGTDEQQAIFTGRIATPEGENLLNQSALNWFFKGWDNTDIANYLGVFYTKEEFEDALRSYLDGEVESGAMTQEEADAAYRNKMEERAAEEALLQDPKNQLQWIQVEYNQESGERVSDWWQFSQSDASYDGDDIDLDRATKLGKVTVPDGGYRAIAYVMASMPGNPNIRWIGTDEPGKVTSAIDTRYVTHINFSFGMIEALQFDPDKPGRPLMNGEVTSPEAYKDPEDGTYHYRVTLNNWVEDMDATVDGTEYLKAVLTLKEQKPDLKVLVSVGGWESDGFSYMAATEEGRAEFIQSCVDLINEYGLDGIDIDWEYPTNGGWGVIAHGDNDVENANALMREMRAAFDEAFPGERKLVTIASGASQPWVDAETFAALDFMNVMCYDMGENAAGLDLASGYMWDHAQRVGDTPENRAKINLGLPFYNGVPPVVAPYYKGWDGHEDVTPEIIQEKMEWVKENGYGGAFYWEYSMDVFPQDVDDPDDPQVKILQRTLYETLNGAVGE